MHLTDVPYTVIEISINTHKLSLLYTQAVRVFKFGPDYLDPQILERGSKAPVTQLDLFMAGEAWCKQQIYR